jgi:hypothetical protein
MAGIGFENAPHYKAHPGSYIGRQIAYFHVRRSDMRNSDGKLDAENFRLAVQAIQTGLEILWVSVPYISDSWGAFQVAVSYDTANTLPQNGSSIEQLLNDTLNDSNIVFQREYLVGSNWYVENDFLSYCDTHYVKDDNGIPQVFNGVEQDEFAAKYLAWL